MPIINASVSTPQKTYTVSELNRHSRITLEKQFSSILVEGEISNLATPSSGHIYFRLKDEKAQIQCAFFKNRAMYLNFKLEEGAKVVLTASASLYEARGDYQLIVEAIQLAGIGKLQLQFEALKQKLASQGLFDAAHKKAIPKLPSRIGLITSPTGAALHDMLTTLKRRFPAIPIALYPTQVQGATAAANIAQQIQAANQHQYCDVLIVARGGGSLEDLWPFNEEVVAQAIYHSQIPIVSGVGHEVDTTLADLCADLRAATPTAAAEAVSPKMADLLLYFSQLQSRMLQHVEKMILQRSHQLMHLQKRLRTPQHLLKQQQLTVQSLQNQLSQLIGLQLKKKQEVLQKLQYRLHQQNPHRKLQQQLALCQQYQHKLTQAIKQILQLKTQRFKQLCATLNATSPLATLDRGYSLTQDEQKNLIVDAKQVALEQNVWVSLKHGQLHCKIIGKK